jgi:hypothetical protein
MQMLSHSARGTLIVGAALALLGFTLYVGFIGNPPVFDDILLVSGRGHAEYATSPFRLALRQPAYFSLALVQVVWGGIEPHRWMSLLFHIACAFSVYCVIRELQKCSLSESPRGKPAAFIAAALFLVHPVAVYAAGYLVQRTIVLATLFSLLSIALYLRGLRQARYGDAVSAGLLFSLAVLSKEHAILVPIAAAAVLLLFRSRIAFAVRYTALFFATCAPAAVLVTLLQKGIVGRPYEHQFEAVAVQITEVHAVGWLQAPWIGSIITQAGLFFRYLILWFWPDTGRMAIDLRVDFAATWAPAFAVAATAGFLLFGIAAIFLLVRGGRLGMVGFGLAYAWVLFLLEFAVIRFQEPFVLYRSYLWAPGLAIAVAPALATLPMRAMLMAGCAAVTFLGVQAHDRLKTFSSGVALWEDAVHKLPAWQIPGGWRTLYQAGRQYLYAGAPENATAVIDRCLAQYPRESHCLLARASISMHLERYDDAIPYLKRLLADQPRNPDARHHLGLVFEELGCRDRAREQYQLAAKLGSSVAHWRLENLDHPGKGFISKNQEARRAGPCRVTSMRIEVPQLD